MAWKPDKAPGRKREQKQRLARQQKRKDFAKNMERAEALARKWCTKNYEFCVQKGEPPLALKFLDWAINRYRYLKHSDPMTKKHKDMHAQWNEILTTAEACKKATDSLWYAVRKVRRDRAVAKFRADRTQSYIENAERIGAAMQAKMQQRAVAAVAFLEDVITERVGAAMQAKLQERAMR